MDGMKYWQVITLGILALGTVVSAMLWLPASAQRTGYDAAYVKQAKADIDRIEAVYSATGDYYSGEVETPAKAQAAHADMGDLYDDMGPAPIAAAGVREQILFASWRCQNYAAYIGWQKPEDLDSIFVRTIGIQLREYCVVQIQAARLRLIDYGVANGVDVYAK